MGVLLNRARKILNWCALTIFCQVRLDFFAGLRPAIVCVLGNHWVKVRIQTIASVQRRLHKIADEEIVKNFVLNSLHERAARHFERNAALEVVLPKIDDRVLAAHPESNKAEVVCQLLLRANVFH